jgi:hypothetical protein
MRPLAKFVPEWCIGDLHFLEASRAWKNNKKEVFDVAGSSGSFEYKANPSKVHSLRSHGWIHQTFDQSSLCSPAPGANSASSILVSRRAESLSACDSPAENVPKELSRLREQGVIPIYMDRLPRRKCRLISPYTTS